METRYVVIEEHTLAYILPGEDKKPIGCQRAHIFRSLIRKGGTGENHGVMGIPIIEKDGVWINDETKIRPATVADFNEYRVSSYGLIQ